MLKPFLFMLVALFIFSLNMPLYAQNETVQCGDIVEGEFTAPAQRMDYRIELAPGDSLNVNSEGIGTSLAFMLALANPAGEPVVTSLTESGRSRPELAPSLFSDILSARGSYNLIVYNDRVFESLGSLNFQNGSNDVGSVGVFVIEIGCTLRDGTVIEPGDSAPAPDSSTTGGDDRGGGFTGYGFPGVVSVDFLRGIEIPLMSGQPQTIPVGGDVALYTYDATAGQIATLSVSRLSGDISIGVTVINKDTNEIIFLGGDAIKQ